MQIASIEDEWMEYNKDSKSKPEIGLYRIDKIQPTMLSLHGYQRDHLKMARPIQLNFARASPEHVYLVPLQSQP